MYESGKPASEICEEYDLCNSTLRRESKRLQMEVDVLKQAALVFARK